MRFTQQQVDEHNRRIAGKADGARPGAGAGEKKQQDADAGKVDHKTGVSEVDGSVRPQFRVTVTLGYGDERRRDADGAVSTILDCLIAARRQLALCSGVGSEGYQGAKGK